MDEFHYKKQNRSTTYWSLVAFVYLLFTDDQDQFCRCYEAATHDDCGNSCWALMQKTREQQKAQKKIENRKYYEAHKAKIKEKTNGRSRRVS